MRPLLVLVPAGLVAACVAGDGALVEVERPVAPFVGARNASAVDLVIAAGPAGGGVLTCDANLLDRVHADVDGTDLVLSVSPGVTSLHDACALHVATEHLRRVVLQGAGDVTASGSFADFSSARSTGSGRLALEALEGERIEVAAESAGAVAIPRVDARALDVRATGSGSLRASGSTATLAVFAAGSGAVNLSDLVAREARVDASGSGVVSVHVTDRAEIRLTGPGDVVIYGGAELDVVDDGAGEVISR